ncbi:MAG: FxLYD domain-containing protein [Rhodothermales bacterium]|nr:FxLYD domain-containing protein [Rhodothermales bacterium]
MKIPALPGWSGVAGVFLALLLFGACAAPADEAVEAAAVLVENVQYTLLPGGARIVTGTLFNPTEDPINNAQIQISLYDVNNVRVSTMSVTIQDVSPGSRKSFREPINTDLDVRGASVKSVLVL